MLEEMWYSIRKAVNVAIYCQKIEIAVRRALLNEGEN